MTNLNNLIIRETTPNDLSDIVNVHDLAFERHEVTKLTTDLLADKSAEPRLSLIALYNNEAVGHVLFTKVSFEGMPNSPLMHILAPLAVKPALQKQGVGGRLIQKGLKHLQAMGCQAVLVLGHKDYYPRYGFLPNAQQLGFAPPYQVLPQFSACWMVQGLTQKGLNLGTGKIKCAKSLNAPEHWRE